MRPRGVLASTGAPRFGVPRGGKHEVVPSSVRKALTLFISGPRPCAECGQSVDHSASGSHTCDPRRRLAFQMLVRHHEVTTFDMDFRDYLSSKEGRFEVWLAARDVRRSA
jgi:hypothetical protein